MTDRMLLRVMARKSIFTGGKYEGLSVQMVLDLGKIWGLVCRYYRYDTISFLPDILDEIGITEEFRIKKPGSDIHLFEKWKEMIREKEDNLTRMKLVSHNKKDRKMKLIRREISRTMSKSNLTNKHRGHKKQSSTGKIN